MALLSHKIIKKIERLLVLMHLYENEVLKLKENLKQFNNIQQDEKFSSWIKNANKILWYPGLTLKQAKVLIVAEALDYYKNKTHTARALGVSRRWLRTFVLKEPQLRKYRIRNL